jgi:hypothetical protein
MHPLYSYHPSHAAENDSRRSNEMFSKQELTNDTTDRWRIGRPQLFEFADGSWLPCKKACYLVNLWLHTDMTYPLHVCNGTKDVVVRTSIWASKRTFHCSDESRFLLRVMDGSCIVGAWRQWNTTWKTKGRVTRNPLKTESELMCSRRVSSSCSTSELRICVWNSLLVCFGVLKDCFVQ